MLKFAAFKVAAKVALLRVRVISSPSSAPSVMLPSETDSLTTPLKQ